MNARIEDVAARAGVSTATVSRALRGLPDVSEKTRQKVLSAAEVLDYSVSPAARALAMGKTNTIAIVVSDFSSWFSSHALQGAQRTFQEQGFATLIQSVRHTRGRAAFDIDIEPLRRRVDGMLIISQPLVEHEVEAVQALGLPVVTAGNRNPPLTSVTIDDELAARTATRHLIDLGHRVIAHLSGPSAEMREYMPVGGRYQGWRAALQENELECGDDLVAASFLDYEGGRDAITALLEKRDDFTAVFVATDLMARGAIQALEERSIAVPADCSVVSIDGDDSDPTFSLTTVAQNPVGIGQLAAETLLSLIAGGQTEEVTFAPAQLRPGKTSTVPSR